MIGETTTTKASLDKTQLWHNRLGHMSLKGVGTLGKHGLLNDKEIKDLEFYEDCILGKAHRLKFDVGIHITKVTLDYSFRSIGLTNGTPFSLSSCHYFVSFVDDYLRKT